jgi:hypothetical protein
MRLAAGSRRLSVNRVHRTHFDDGVLAERLRGQRELVKGRFFGGLVAYVLAEDPELYATAFRKNEIESIIASLRATGAWSGAPPSSSWYSRGRSRRLQTVSAEVEGERGRRAHRRGRGRCRPVEEV